MAQDAKNRTDEAIQNELEHFNELNKWMENNTDGDKNTVTLVESEDGITIPVPKGFVPSTVEGEKKVEEGFVIKEGDDGSKKEGINEFIWVPVPNPSEMFTVDEEGNSTGQLYNFGTTDSPKVPAEKIDYSIDGYREPCILTDERNGDASTYRSEGIELLRDEVGITGTKNEEILANWEKQLKNEFKAMKASVEKYKGFYIGRYETGNLKQTTAVVQKNNSDITNENWYIIYQKSKSIVANQFVSSSMIWGCQWDATLRWFQRSDNEEVVNFVTDSTGRGYYSESPSYIGFSTNNVYIPTGSNEAYKVNNIYDMAGNVMDLTLEGFDDTSRICRRRRSL